MTAVPVVELGGTHASAALVEVGSGCPRIVDDVVHRVGLEPDGSAATLLDILVECAGRLPAAGGASWRVAVPGPFDYRAGIARHHDVGKFESLAGVDVGAALRSRIRPRPGAVTFVNDAHAFTVGEWCAGAVVGRERIVGLTLGTGAGSGFLRGGRIVERGPTVPPEGRMDLTLIDGRPLEEVVSRRAILRAYAAATGIADGLDVHDIADRARAGDRAAADLFGSLFRRLGAAVGPWLERFSADVVVVGGSMTGAWDLIAEPFTAGLGTTGQRVEVRPTALCATAALIGAAAQLGPD